MIEVGAPTSDPIGETLRSLNVTSSVFCLSELRAPWGFQVEGAAIAKFHLVLSGSGWLSMLGHDPVLLRAGDLALLPHGDTHTLRDDPASPVTALDRLIAEHPLESGNRLRCGGAGPLTRVLCGGFAVSSGHPHAVLAVLPHLLRIDAQSVAATSWLAPVLTALETELESRQRGANAVQTKIADVFLTQALRSWLLGAEHAGVLPAGILIQDETIAAAVSLVRNNLAAAWTIDKLASNVGLSRSAFVMRFRHAAGDSPMHYVIRLRLSAAAALLATTRLSVHEIATATGYDNEASLTKAFKRELGVAPGAYRTSSRPQAASALDPAVGTRMAAGVGTRR